MRIVGGQRRETHRSSPARARHGSSLCKRNRKATQDIAQLISKRGISATYYHAGLNNAQREVRQKDWMQGKVRVIVATNAFGMGIDKPDVRCVIHLDLPEHLEAYYQEAGRAGRDEKRAFAVILAYRTEGEELIERAEATYPPIDFIKKVISIIGQLLSNSSR